MAFIEILMNVQGLLYKVQVLGGVKDGDIIRAVVVDLL